MENIDRWASFVETFSVHFVNKTFLISERFPGFEASGPVTDGAGASLQPSSSRLEN